MELQGQRQLRNRLENMSDGQKVLAALQSKVTQEAKRNTRAFYKTGKLGASIEAGYLSDTVAFVRVTAAYAKYVEIGTGIYGPKHKKIEPKTKKALAFHSQKAGAERFGIKYRRTGAMTAASERKYGPGADFVVVKSVKGRKATPFLAPAVKTVAKGAGLKDTYVGLWNDGA